MKSVMQLILILSFVLCVIGLIYYGWAKIVLAVILISVVLFAGSAMVYGIRDGIRERKAAAPSKLTTLGLSQQEETATTVREGADPELDALRKMMFGKDDRK